MPRNSTSFSSPNALAEEAAMEAHACAGSMGASVRSRLHKASTKIYCDRSLTPEQKRVVLREIQDAISDVQVIVENATEAIRSITRAISGVAA